MAVNTIRFSGLASGLDTESLVNSMLMPQKQKVDTATQDKLLLELKKDAWKEMNTKIYDFYKNTLDASRLESTFNKKDISMSQSGVIEVNSNGSFPDGTHEIVVGDLAKGAFVNTKGIKIKTTGDDGKVIEESAKKDTTLADLGIDTDKKIEIKVNGKPLTISLTKEIVKEDGTKETVSKTLEDLEQDFKSTGLNASFDESSGAFFLSTKQTGGSQSIDFTGTSADLMNKLGFRDKDNKEFNITDASGKPVELSETEKYSGQPAKVTYNGVEITSETNSVKINGMDIKIVSKGTTNVVATRNTEAIVDFAEKFVNEYNKLLEDINTKIDAPYNKNYKPLTTEQKKEMSEDDIKLWNNKVNESILRKDSVLTDIASSMRSIIGSGIISTGEKDDKGNEIKISLSSIGVSTSLWSEKGKLTLDKDKLRAAVNEDPDKVVQLFTKKVDSKKLAQDSGENYELNKDKYDKLAMSQSGIGTKIYDNISKKLKGNTSKSTNFLFNDKALEKQITEKKDQVTKLEKKMTTLETMYYKKFTAMEKMLSQLNSQSSWIAGQLGGM